MLVTDLLRGCLVRVLLVVRRPDQVWIAYVVMAFIVGAQGFFEPARTATIPNVTSAEQLMPANALSSATWSAMLALGASIGGLVTARRPKHRVHRQRRVVHCIGVLHRPHPVR